MKVIVFAGLIIFTAFYTHAAEPLSGQPKVATPATCFDELSRQAWIDYKTKGTPIPLWLKWDQGQANPVDDPIYRRNWGFSSPRELVTAKIALDIVAPQIVSRSTCYAKSDDKTGTDASAQDQRLKKTLEYVIRALGEKGALSDREIKRALRLLEDN